MIIRLMYLYLHKKYKLNNVYSHRIYKEQVSQNIDNECEKYFLSTTLIGLNLIQFGIQLNHRDRNTWSRHWNHLHLKKSYHTK